MERRIILEGVKNCRDLGGLRTADGRELRTGFLIRSAELSRATEADWQLLREHRVTAVIDLRTELEKQRKPDRIAQGVEHIQIPIFDEATAGITREDGTPKPWVVPDMVSLYGVMVRQKSCQAALKQVFDRILEQDLSRGSILWHCTAGKDRCGLISALLLAGLGVTRQDVMADYLLTNETCEAEADELYQKALAAGAGELIARAAREVFLAKEEYLNSALDAVDSFGGGEAFFLNVLQIPAEKLRAFREIVLQ